MQLPVPLLFLVCSGAVFAEDAPRITIVNEDIGVPETEDDAAAVGAPPGGEAMQQLLNWAINNSDPERLKELMHKYKENNLTVKDVYGQDMIDALFVNEGSVLKEMSTNVADFANASVTDDDLEASLQRLQELVEQVDNAGNLHRNGGLKPLLELGVSDAVVNKQPEVIRSEWLRALALWTLGVAVQNNEPVQADLLELGGLPLLVRRLSVCTGEAGSELASSEYCGKLIFAISGLVKNNETIQALADSEGLFEWLLDVGIAHTLPGVAKKSMALLDIALSQSPNLRFLSALPGKQDAVASSLLTHIGGTPSAPTNFDTAEKGLRLVNRLLSLRPMLFRSSFRSALAEAVTSASEDCVRIHGSGEELCEGFSGLAKQADLALVVRELADEDL